MDRRKLTLVACAIYIKRRIRKEKNTQKSEAVLVSKIFRNREEKGEFHHLFQEYPYHFTYTCCAEKNSTLFAHKHTRTHNEGKFFFCFPIFIHFKHFERRKTKKNGGFL